MLQEPEEELSDLEISRRLLRRAPSEKARAATLPYERPDLWAASQACGFEIDWLWPGRIPEGKLSVLAGYPGVGKSLVALDMAARFSAGLPWPDGQPPCGVPDAAADDEAADARGEADADSLRVRNTAPEPDTAPGVETRRSRWRPPRRRVLVLSYEDNSSDTIAQRLLAAGGNLEQVGIVHQIITSDTVDEDDPEGREVNRQLSLDRDMHHLENLLREWRGTRLIIIDPIASHCDGKENEPYLRKLLARLVELAHEWGVAILAIAHLRRDPAHTDIYKALGSRALATIPRTIWTVQADPGRRGRRLFLPLKVNLAGTSSGLAFGFANDALVWDPEPVGRMASDPSPVAIAERVMLDEAIHFLTEMLAEGDLPAADLFATGQKCGLSGKTLHRAKAELKVGSVRKGFGKGGVWYWSLDRRTSAQHAEAVRRLESKNSKSMTIYGHSEDATQPPVNTCENPSIDGQLAIYGGHL